MTDEKPKKLEVGEKYLSISILNGQIKLAAFKNKNKTQKNSPDYTGNGIAVWIAEKKEGKDEMTDKELGNL